MVKVWYTPPPYGPRTSLDRPAYGLGKVGTTPEWLVRLAKAPKVPAITGVITVFSIMAWLPLCTSVCDFYCTYVIQSYSHFSLLLSTVGAKLPFTMSPEYIAAQRAYMRYHNMNPIYGLSSKYVVSCVKRSLLSFSSPVTNPCFRITGRPELLIHKHRLSYSLTLLEGMEFSRLHFSQFHIM